MSKIDSTPPIIYYTGTGTVSRYPFSFMFWENKDIRVYLDDQVQTAGYSVQSANPEEGGTIVFTTAPAQGVRIAISCETEAKRTSEFEESGVFRAKVMNDELNHIYASIQQLGQKVRKCLSWPISFSGGDLQLPKADPGKTIIWNAEGTGLQNSHDNIDNLYTVTKAQTDLAVAKAGIATEQAEIAATQAAAATASASSAAAVVDGFDAHSAELQAQYDRHAAQKVSDYDLNAAGLLDAYNANHDSKLKNYNDNNNAKLAAYNTNAADKQAAVDASADAAAVSAAAAQTALDSAVGTINEAKTSGLNDFNANVSAQLAAYDANAAQKVSDYNTNASEKQNSVDVSAAAAAQSAAEAKQFRDEAQQIADMPLATENIVGGAKLATVAETQAGIDDSTIITPAKLKVVADTKASLSAFDLHAGSQDNPHHVSKAQVGLGNVDNTSDADKPVSAAVQSALNTKQNIVTGAATTIAGTNLTINRALVSDGNGKVGVAAVTAAELGYLSGVTSAVQTQLNAKATPAAIAAYQPPLTALSQTSGTIALAVNKIYTLSISGTTTFSLPTPSNKNVFNQIKIMLKVTGTPTINWGTTQFFNKTTPEIAAGSYDVYFDFDKLLNVWICGAMPKGLAG